MKNNRMKIFLMLMYLIILLALLILQYCFMDGVIPRLIANAIALVIAVPCVVTLIVWGGNVSDVYVEPEILTDETISVKLSDETIKLDADLLAGKLQEYQLTRRENDVVWLIYRGYTNAQIAEELYISEYTVKKHAGHIYEKMSVSGRKELVERIKEEHT